MALPDLTGQKIQNTYQRILQVSSSGQVTNGTGSLIPLLEVTASLVNSLTSVGVNGSNNQLLTDNGDGTVTSEANIRWDGNNFNIGSSTSAKPTLNINNTNDDPEAPELILVKGVVGADGDDLGKLIFGGFDPDGNEHTFAQALGEIVVAANGSEEGKLTLSVASHDAELQPGLILASGNAEDEVDVTIGNGATSTTTIAGNFNATRDRGSF